MDSFQITYVKESKNKAVEKNLRVTINYYKELCLPVIIWNKKYIWMQVVQISYTLEKSFLQLPLLKLCELFLFRESSALWSVRDMFSFSENKKKKQKTLWEVNCSICR